MSNLEEIYLKYIHKSTNNTSIFIQITLLVYNHSKFQTIIPYEQPLYLEHSFGCVVVGVLQIFGTFSQDYLTMLTDTVYLLLIWNVRSIWCTFVTEHLKVVSYCLYVQKDTYITAFTFDSLVVECWLRVREVPGSIPSQGPRHTKDVIKMVPVVPLISTQHWKGKYWLFLKN